MAERHKKFTRKTDPNTEGTEFVRLSRIARATRAAGGSTARNCTSVNERIGNRYCTATVTFSGLAYGLTAKLTGTFPEGQSSGI